MRVDMSDMQMFPTHLNGEDVEPIILRWANGVERELPRLHGNGGRSSGVPLADLHAAAHTVLQDLLEEHVRMDRLDAAGFVEFAA